MVNSFKIARNALESLYTDTCAIYEYKEEKDKYTKRTASKEVVIVENEPCRLSYKSINKSSDENTPKITQVIKLFISNKIDIKAGSKIVVTKNNKTTEYKNSGEPAIYSNHQEIILELFERYA